MRPREFVRVLLRRTATEVDFVRSRRAGRDVAIFHEFHAPPYGGGNQFLLALRAELSRRGLDVEANRVSARTPVCLYNSFNFDFTRLRRFSRDDLRMVHRVDGPVGAYRGFDDGTDRRIVEINALADATILQSHYSLEKHSELGLLLRNPMVIHNAVDPAIFHPPTERPCNERMRVIATSWSDNPRKGFDVLAWLDRNLDFDAYDVTFAGRTQMTFSNINVIDPLPSRELAEELRRHDAFIAASRDDPCSNALLEALACGLPALYLRSGGHPELVGDAGIGFEAAEEVPAALARLRDELDERRAAIRIPSLAEVADRYLDVLRS